MECEINTQVQGLPKVMKWEKLKLMTLVLLHVDMLDNTGLWTKPLSHKVDLIRTVHS